MLNCAILINYFLTCTEMGTLNTQVQVHIQATLVEEHVLVFGFTPFPHWTLPKRPLHP